MFEGAQNSNFQFKFSSALKKILVELMGPTFLVAAGLVVAVLLFLVVLPNFFILFLIFWILGRSRAGRGAFKTDGVLAIPAL